MIVLKTYLVFFLKCAVVCRALTRQYILYWIIVKFKDANASRGQSSLAISAMLLVVLALSSFNVYTLYTHPKVFIVNELKIQNTAELLYYVISVVYIYM